MLRRTPMKRSGWPKRLPHTAKPVAKKLEKLPLSPVACASVATKSIVKSVARMTKVGDLPHTPYPKPDTHRNPALLAMAKGRRCLLRVPGVCQGGTATTVAAHSNWACHGKGMGKKASDAYTVWGCAACHIGWLDQGPAPKAVKQATFMRAHADQVLEWRRIAKDPTETPRDRKAATWALEKLNAALGTMK